MDNTLDNTSGILLIDKPQDWTSHDVVAKLRNVLKIRKIGHAGTLDPMATGLLIILVGRATKLSDQLLNQDKQYQMEILFGQQTDTADADGQITSEDARVQKITAELVEQAIPQLLGRRWQKVPNYSAVKVGGKKLYELARKGKELAERPSKEIEIKDWKMLSFEAADSDNPWPRARCVVDCSKGTYVRVLAEELAEVLGTKAHLTALRRTRSGDYLIEQAHDLSEVIEDENRLSRLLPV